MGKFSTKLKREFKDTTGCFFFYVFRLMERGLSVQNFYSVLKPVFFARTRLNTFGRKPKLDRPVPDFLQLLGTTQVARRQRLNMYLNHVIGCFPDRLARAKWLSGCKLEGLEYLQLARQNGRPVILAICHFGPLDVLGFWLRAAGWPVATFAGRNFEDRTRTKRLKDRLSPFPQFLPVFYEDQLREAAEFIAAGNLLIMTFDVPIGKQMRVPFIDGWSFRMATGVVRLASRHQAELIPCSVIDEGSWHFRIKFGRPVPRDYLTEETDHTVAGKHIFQEMVPVFQAFPEQCSIHMTRCLHPDPLSSTSKS